ncbi:MAG: hypothetical protein EOO27_33880, partial [Comamonadaceae bacterium]
MKGSAPGDLGKLKRAYFLLLPNAHLLDLAGPLQLVATLEELGIARVAVECIGPHATVRTFQKITLLDIQALPKRLAESDVLFVIGSAWMSSSVIFWNVRTVAC